MHHRIIDRPVVVIADWRVDDSHIDEGTDDLDLYTREELDEVLTAIRAVCPNLTVYEDPPTFIDHISSHQTAIVIPFWAGRRSRNRTALLAATAEAYGLEFFGPDAYGYIIGQDKALSKHVAREFGLKTPASVLIRTFEQLSLTDLVKLPVVVKPNLQGSSIGISQQSLCFDYTEARTLAARLLEHFSEPILVEHFVEGLEVTVVLWSKGEDIRLFQAIEIYEPTGEIDFTKTIWSYELKKVSHRPAKAQRAISLPRQDESALRSLFATMGKLELVRIDGRINAAGFHFLEINPEPYLGRIGSVAKAFALAGWSYEDMFYQLLSPINV